MKPRSIYKEDSIIVDNDHNLNYETNGIFKKILNLFLIPILNIIPSGFQKYIKKTHKAAEEVVEHKTTHKALETLYKHGQTHKSKNVSQKIMRKIWFGLNNSKAVRNRLKLVKREVKATINTLAETQNNINILSIASGSARAVIETLSSIKLPDKKISVKFLDKNEQAIEYSKELAKNLYESYNLEWITDTASNFAKYYGNEERPDIVEMVGLMDYFDDKQTIKILSLIFNHLQKSGFLITANIMHNREERFLSGAIGWKMIYKTPENLIDLAVTAGFNEKNIKIICEPLKIHAVLIAKK